MFNKYEYIKGLQSQLEEAIKDGEIKSADQLQDYVHNDIDNSCIYYSDCFDIIKELNFTDFSSNNELGFEITNVNQAAFCALWELVYSEIDFSELEDLIESQEEE